MKRLQIYIDEELDEALAVRAQREGTSKAGLIREYVADRLGRGTHGDSIDRLVGRFRLEDGPGSEDVDEVVYPR
jgi:hypothetical protein